MDNPIAITADTAGLFDAWRRAEEAMNWAEHRWVNALNNSIADPATERERRAELIEARKAAYEAFRRALQAAKSPCNPCYLRFDGEVGARSH